MVRVLVVRSDARLVTVVGPGGAGKTRLALAAARLMLDEMPGGVFIAPLASAAVLTSLGPRDGRSDCFYGSNVSFW